MPYARQRGVWRLRGYGWPTPSRKLRDGRPGAYDVRQEVACPEGRPRTSEKIAGLTVRVAKENSGWSYTTIMGALANLGHVVARETVRNILKEHGIEPSPERSKRMPWSTFLKSHWGCIAAADLFTVEVWSCIGLIRYYVLTVGFPRIA